LRMLLSHPASESFKVENTAGTSHHILGDGVPDRAAIVDMIAAWLKTLRVKSATAFPHETLKNETPKNAAEFVAGSGEAH